MDGEAACARDGSRGGMARVRGAAVGAWGAAVRAAHCVNTLRAVGEASTVLIAFLIVFEAWNVPSACSAAWLGPAGGSCGTLPYPDAMAWMACADVRVQCGNLVARASELDAARAAYLPFCECMTHGGAARTTCALLPFTVTSLALSFVLVGALAGMAPSKTSPRSVCVAFLVYLVAQAVATAVVECDNAGFEEFRDVTLYALIAPSGVLAAMALGVQAWAARRGDTAGLADG